MSIPAGPAGIQFSHNGQTIDLLPRALDEDSVRRMRRTIIHVRMEDMPPGTRDSVLAKISAECIGPSFIREWLTGGDFSTVIAAMAECCQQCQQATPELTTQAARELTGWFYKTGGDLRALGVLIYNASGVREAGKCGASEYLFQQRRLQAAAESQSDANGQTSGENPPPYLPSQTG